MVIGDFNTGRASVDEPGNTFFCRDRFEALETEAGLVDAWRSRNGDRMEPTWFSSALLPTSTISGVFASGSTQNSTLICRNGVRKRRHRGGATQNEAPIANPRFDNRYDIA